MLLSHSLDAYLARHPPANQLQPDEKKKTLVVLGSGWGSTSLLKGLNTENYHVIVVSPRNYFLFTRMSAPYPGLWKRCCRLQRLVLWNLGRLCSLFVTSFGTRKPPSNSTRRHVRLSTLSTKLLPSPVEPPHESSSSVDDGDIKGDISETQIKFDYLVVGVGAQNSTFGIPGVQEHACFLKEVWDATKIRTRIMVDSSRS